MTGGLRRFLRVVAWSARLPLGRMRPWSEDPIENLAAARLTLCWTHGASAAFSAAVGLESTWLAAAVGWAITAASYTYLRRTIRLAERLAEESLAKEVMSS